VVLAALGFSDYGLYNVIGGIIAMFTFINGAMSNMTSRFITFHLGQRDYKRLSEVFSMAFFIHCCLAFVILILGETVGLWFLCNKMVIPEGRMFAAQWLYQLSIASTLMSIISVPFMSDIIAHEKMSIYAYISIFDAVLRLIIVLMLAYSPIDKLIFYATLVFAVQVLDFLFNLIYCRYHFVESKARKVWDKGLFEEMGKFIGWSTFGNFSYLFYTQGLNILINMFCGPVVNAARGIAVQVESAMAQFTNSIQTAINPQIIKSYSSNDRDRMKLLIFASSRYCFYLMFLLSLPVILCANYILGLWLGVFPDHTVNFIRLTLVCTLLETLINPLFTANLATGNVAIYNKSLAILSFSFIPITYLGIRTTHIPEIVFVLNILRNVIGIGVRMFIFRSQLGVGTHEYASQVLWRILPVVVIASVVPFIVYRMIGSETFLSFLLTCITAVISTMLSVYMVGLNKFEREYISSRGMGMVLSKFHIRK
jgi:O-antigen/teichoic acid export membrane protein